LCEAEESKSEEGETENNKDYNVKSKQTKVTFEKQDLDEEVEK